MIEDRPSIETTKKLSRALLTIASARLPVRIAGRPVPDGHSDRRYTPVWVDKPDGHRYWMSALYVRALTAYESTLLLADAGLDPDARAHLRIMFDYLVAFAWLSLEPEDAERSFRLVRYGSGFRERMLLERAQQVGPEASDIDKVIDELALEIEINEKVKPPPPVASMCEELDTRLGDRLGDEVSFRSWYTLVYRGASGFLHVTATGMDAVVTASTNGFVIDRPDATIDRVYEIAVGLMSALLVIAADDAPWLVDADALASLRVAR